MQSPLTNLARVCWSALNQARQEFRENKVAKARDALSFLVKQASAPRYVRTAAWQLLSRTTNDYHFARYCLEQALLLCDEMEPISELEIDEYLLNAKDDAERAAIQADATRIRSKERKCREFTTEMLNDVESWKETGRPDDGIQRPEIDEEDVVPADTTGAAGEREVIIIHLSEFWKKLKPAENRPMKTQPMETRSTEAQRELAFRPRQMEKAAAGTGLPTPEPIEDDNGTRSE